MRSAACLDSRAVIYIRVSRRLRRCASQALQIAFIGPFNQHSVVRDCDNVNGGC